MSSANFEIDLQREIADYEMNGGPIFSTGRNAGFKGRPVSDSPYPANDWRYEVWCNGWLSRFAFEMRPEQV